MYVCFKCTKTYIVKYKDKYQRIKQLVQDRMNLLCYIYIKKTQNCSQMRLFSFLQVYIPGSSADFQERRAAYFLCILCVLVSPVLIIRTRVGHYPPLLMLQYLDVFHFIYDVFGNFVVVVVYISIVSGLLGGIFGALLGRSCFHINF